jgi:hypothetical protein
MKFRANRKAGEKSGRWLLRASGLVGLAVGLLLAPAHGEALRLNQIQAIGSHNSYHLAPPAALLNTLRRFSSEVDAWNYSHPPLGVQLRDFGLRQFELDVFADPDGGLFANPLGRRLLALTGAAAEPFDPQGLMQQPGFKVLHVPDIDFWSNALTLRSALRELSEALLPDDLPILVLVEAKETGHALLPTRPLPFTRERLLELEAEILEVIPREKIVTPDEVRGGKETLRQAILGHGWPEVDSLRGRFIFALDNTGEIRDRYLEGNPSLEGRLFFASAPSHEHPSAAWFKRNDPVGGFAEIQHLVRRGFLVRTRADTRAADPVMRERAFASGAQWVSTDHFVPSGDPAERVQFPDGATVRRNPLVSPDPGPLER